MKTYKQITIITIIIWHLALGEEPFIHQKLDNTGIFFEKITEINTNTKSLRIITKIDIPDTKQLVESLTECYGYLKILCDELTEKNTNDLCKPFRKELKWHLSEIQREENKLQDMFGRKKRGLVDAGGKLSKFFFGTMDSEDATEIYDQLNNLQNNQVKLLELEKQQIAVIKSNFEALSKPINQLQDETNEVQEKLNQLITRTNDQNTFIERAQNLTHQVTELSGLILIQCMHINRLQEEATEIIITLNMKKLHPLIITHDKTIEIIRNNSKNVNPKMTRHDILRQIIETDYTEINGQIMIKITIPIIDIEGYTLYKAYLLPFTTEKEHRIYVINTEYIALNNEKTKTIELHTEDINKCKPINSNLEKNFLLCQHTQPILNAQNPHCISTLLTNQLNAEKHCKSLPTSLPNTIVKLQTTNTWLYTANTNTDLIIKCSNNTQKIQIINEGLITFLTSCTITTKDFTVIVTGDPATIELDHQTTQIESSEEKTVTKNRQLEPQNLKRIKLINHQTHNKDFMDETYKINQLEKATADIELNKKHQLITKITTTTLYGICTFVIVAIIVVIMKMKKHQKTRNTITINGQTNTPENRHQNNPTKVI